MKKITPLICIAFLFTTACKLASHDGNNGESINQLDEATARRYVANYAPRAGVVSYSPCATNERSGNTLSGPGELPDTRCIWFGLEQLQSLVARIANEKGDGIRFYLSTYDSCCLNRNKATCPPDSLLGYNTLVMVSTKDSSVVLPGDSIIHYHRDYYTNVKNSRVRQHGFIVCADPENHGELCPPPSNCYSLGATLLEQ